jgi:hypothetical protein
LCERRSEVLSRPGPCFHPGRNRFRRATATFIEKECFPINSSLSTSRTTGTRRGDASRQKHQASCRCISSTRSFPMLSPASTSLPTGLPETRGTDKIRSVCACPTPEGRPESSDVPRPGILVAAAPGELEPSAGAGMSRKECGAPLEARCVSLHPILSATHCHTCQSPPKPRRYSKRDANVTWMQAP